jgi:hypothetical protein
MFLGDTLDPAFPVIDRFRTDVQVADDDDLTALGDEAADAGGEGVEVV